MAVKKRALISVSDKRYVTNLGRDLVKLGFELYSTGGTYQKLKEGQIPVKELSRAFKSPELLGGRVKTLHPHVFAAILAERSNTSHMNELKKLGIQPFDLIVVNFYPFGEKVQPGKTKLSEATELIDIGGPSMVRAAAKNYRNVGVVTNIDQYRDLLRELRETGDLSDETRIKLARDVFRTTAQYESGVAAYFDATSSMLFADEEQPQESGKMPALPREMLPDRMEIKLKKLEQLRYGENPHQEGARYRAAGLPSLSFRLLQGKEMSYNNYLDAEAALTVVSTKYPKPYAACVVKHHNPCGIAVGDDPLKTFMNGRDADEKSAFGGIVGLNYKVDLSIAKEIRRSFFEVVIAPGYDDAALKELSSKKNLRVIEADPNDLEAIRQGSAKLTHSIFGVLLQSHDTALETWEQLQIVSNTKPDDKLKEDILLGLIFIRFLKSNAICLVKNGVMISAGMGQMSRVDAMEIAINRAGKLAKGAILASDGFFPFADSIELAGKSGVACVISPAGSKRDIEVVDMANKLKLPLLFAPHRHFRH